MKQRTLIELLGVIGVIASLVFVGIEVRQGAAASRSATVLQLKDAWVQLNLASATSVELARAFEAVENKGYENSSFVDKSLVDGFQRTLLHNSSNAYYQYRNGTLDESQWIPHMREIQTFPNNPVLMRTWTNWKHVYDDPFIVLIDGLIQDTVH